MCSSDHSMSSGCWSWSVYTKLTYKNIDLVAFSRDIAESRLYNAEVLAVYSISDYTTLFDAQVRRIIDQHAALCTRTKSQGAYDFHELSTEVREAKRQYRRFEGRFHQTQSPSDKTVLITVRKTVCAIIDESRASWLKSKVIHPVNDHKRHWRTAKKLLRTTKSDNMSDFDCASMCKILSSFFSDKVNDVRTTYVLLHKLW